MKCIPVQEAVGAILCHDITQILPGEFKGRRFKKGHIIQEEDIPVLLSLGKDNIYVWENLPGMVHENDAATFLKDITMGDGLTFGEIKEGKITFTAAHDGLLKVDADRLFQLNMLGEISFASLHNNLPVKFHFSVHHYQKLLPEPVSFRWSLIRRNWMRPKIFWMAIRLLK